MTFRKEVGAMKTCKRLKCWAAVLCMVLVQMMSLMSVSAAPQEQTVSVTVTLDDNGKVRSGVTFAVYQVADAADEQGGVSFTLTDEFAGSGVSLDMQTAEEMLDAIEVLGAYIGKSSVKPTVTLTTDAQGVCGASDLAQGIYLLVPGNADAYGVIASSLVMLPFTDADGDLQYEETLVPKYTNPDPEQPTPPPTTPERPPSEDVPILGIEDISPYIGIGLLAVGVLLLLVVIILMISRRN